MNAITSILPIAQIILAVLLMIGVLIQRSESALGSSFGGGDSLGQIGHTRRGFEKALFNATIVIAVLFVASALLALVV